MHPKKEPGLGPTCLLSNTPIGDQVNQITNMVMKIALSCFEMGDGMIKIVEILLNMFAKSTVSLSALQNNIAFQFSALVYGLYANLCFSGRLVTSQKKSHFYSLFASFLVAV